MWSNDRHFPPGSTTRGFLTPQSPAWKKSHSTILPLSERKRTSPADKNDFFHVMHKVPACDSPYGRAKHVQLIDKDPSKAISLFWAAINAGDRVDSALKDMAVVMRQLDRSDEAIEAIKSFRHLCTYDSQESLDNVLVELYKRSGRIEEEIEMLQNRLKNIEEGTVFGGKRTKIVKSQGKRILITIEQEKARILGNLAWAYLQQHNYGIAEQHYRKALALEPDTNKQCNLAICLMHMKRISEAKSLLQDVKASLGNEEMDKSFSKSYERAFEMLIQVEPQSMVEPVTQEQTDKGRESRTSLKEASIFLPRNEDNMPGFMDKIQPCVHWDGKMLADEQNYNCFEYDDRSSKYTPLGSKCDLQSSSQAMSTENWGKGSYSENSYEGSAHKRICSATFRKNSEVLYTQPRGCSWESNNSDQNKRERWGGEDTFRNPSRRLSFEQVKDEFQDDLSEVLLTQPCVLNLPSKHNLNEEPLVSCKYESNTEVERPKNTVNNKSWADMAEEEEEELSGSKCLNKEKEFNDENMNSNIINQHHPDSKNHHIRSITQRLESLDMNTEVGACNAPPYIVSRRNRLQVFREITSP